jgi:hypothetical protein
LDTSLPSLHDFCILLQAEIAQLTRRQRDFIGPKLLKPDLSQLRWEYGANEEYEVWVFADMGERSVVAQYCRGGFGSLGKPWGINFLGADYFGQDCGWYSNLAALLEDWGIGA